MQELTQSRLKEMLKYDPETGVFVWLVGRVNKGKTTGSVNARGYLRIGIKKTLYYSHRLAWLYVYGTVPKNIDHINGIRNDNRIENLRECTQSENCFNVGISSRNSSGFKGVHWCNRDKKWIANIRILGAKKTIGYFLTAESAGAAYDAKAKELHGDFYRSPL